jgi:hypothetical protein
MRDVRSPGRRRGAVRTRRRRIGDVRRAGRARRHRSGPGRHARRL